MYEQILCKECGEYEMVQVGTEQVAEQLCYHCYEEEL
jgi:formylmethanofuran dehydrogenase subunit E